jgi:hypothetical protein
MKTWLAFLIVLWFAFMIVLALATNAGAFRIVTPLGITITATSETVKQYNRHWACYSNAPIFPKRPDFFEDVDLDRIGPLWKNINWTVIDEFFLLLQDKYNAPRADPRTLVIVIRELDYGCKDESSYPYSYEFSGYGYRCIDGVYPSENVIAIHLGDDPGQPWEYSINKPFCGTALDWELFHYFLRSKGDSCWWDEFNPACQQKYRSPSGLCE